MGVYIPNIEMPKSGEVLMIDMSDNGICDAEYWDNKKVVRKKECIQAVEIAVPHGRLGDLDELLNEADRHYPSFSRTEYVSEYDIRNAKTIIEAEKE